LPDPKAGEAITLAVVLMPGVILDPVDLLSFLAGRLPKYMLPESVRVLPSLPLNASGKVARAQLRILLAPKTSEGDVPTVE
jgi:fatty-acyl-CoA synthase